MTKTALIPMAFFVLIKFSIPSYSIGWEVYTKKGFEKVNAIVEIRSSTDSMYIRAIKISGNSPEIIYNVMKIIFKGNVEEQSKEQIINKEETQYVEVGYAKPYSMFFSGANGDFTSEQFILPKGYKSFNYSCEKYNNYTYLDVFKITLINKDGEEIDEIRDSSKVNNLWSSNNVNGKYVTGHKIIDIRNEDKYFIRVKCHGTWKLEIVFK